MTNRTAAAAASLPRERSHRKRILFYVINIAIVTLVGTAMMTNSHAGMGDGLFVIALTMLCTLPLLFIRSYRGKYSLMIVLLAYYYGSFAAKDLVALASNKPMAGPAPDAFLSGGEIAILLGAVCFILGYVSVARLYPERGPGILSRDWSPAVMLAAGTVIWAIGFYVTTTWQFGIADRYSNVTLSQSIGGFVSLLRMLHPLGSLILIYLFLTSRSKPALFVLVITMLADVVLGFLGDSKEIAVRAPILYLFSAVLLRERLPLAQGIAFLLITSILFSVFSAYRGEVHSRHESRDHALSRIDSRLGSIAGSDSLGERFSGGLEYFTDRISLKIFVELIVERSGKDVEFLNGYTIEPLLYAFIPRLIAPDKTDSSMAGLVFNQKFHISAAPETYISMSQVGELYWNFGWPGLIVGMFAIGAVMAAVASAVRLDTRCSLPRYLLLLLTIYLLCLRFEGALAGTYTIWMRAAVLLFLIHLVMPKARRRVRAAQ